MGLRICSKYEKLVKIIYIIFKHLDKIKPQKLFQKLQHPEIGKFFCSGEENA